MHDRLLILDTDILSLVGRQRPPPGLRSWLLEVGPERLAICFPVVTELLRGVYLLREKDPQRASEIREWISQIMATDFIVPEMSPEVAEMYARMTSMPCLRHMWTAQRHEKRNRLGHDLMIASVSIIHDAPIITANTRDYVLINEWFPLPGVYHPLEQRWHVLPDREMSMPPLPAVDNARSITSAPNFGSQCWGHAPRS